MCLLDVENGQAMLKHRVTVHPAVHMTWTEQEPAAAAVASSWSASLYAPSAQPRSCYSPGPPSAMPPVPHAKPGADVQRSNSAAHEQLSILCAADAAARVSLLAFGSYPLAAVDVWRPGQGAGARVLHVRCRLSS
jgi:hypothetical protein